jgi:hypothetical protein
MLRTGTSTTSLVPIGLRREEERFLAAPRLERPALDFLPVRRTAFFLPSTRFFLVEPFLVEPFLVFFFFRFDDLANLAPFTVFVRPPCRRVHGQA